eukprot:scaffold47543_cov32-Tisochrysis_lutea.AAC.3
MKRGRGETLKIGPQVAVAPSCPKEANASSPLNAQPQGIRTINRKRKRGRERKSTEQNHNYSQFKCIFSCHMLDHLVANVS